MPRRSRLPTKNLNVLMSPEMHERLQKVALKRRRSMASLARDAIEVWLAQQPDANDDQM